jgi:hypothetical protein
VEPLDRIGGLRVRDAIGEGSLLWLLCRCVERRRLLVDPDQHLDLPLVDLELVGELLRRRGATERGGEVLVDPAEAPGALVHVGRQRMVRAWL